MYASVTNSGLETRQLISRWVQGDFDQYCAGRETRREVGDTEGAGESSRTCGVLRRSLPVRVRSRLERDIVQLEKRETFRAPLLRGGSLTFVSGSVESVVKMPCARSHLVGLFEVRNTQSVQWSPHQRNQILREVAKSRTLE